MDKYFAKTAFEETIASHTANLIKQLNLLKSLYENKVSEYLDWEILRIVCLYHDIGKADINFQNYLRAILKIDLLEAGELGKLSPINHNFISPAFIPKSILEPFDKEDRVVIFQSIFRHHIRHEPDAKALEKYVKLIEFEFDKFDFEEKGLQIPIREKPSLKYMRNTVNKYITESMEFDSDEDQERIFYKYVMVKGLLNRIDYAASTVFSSEEDTASVELEPDELGEIVKDNLAKAGYKFNSLQEYMIENRDSNNIVVAATGFGKTEAALLWIGKNKGFFTLPLKVSINAIYDRLIEMYKTLNIGNEHKIGLLHSDTFSEYLKRHEGEDDEFEFEKHLKETKQLSLPLTVCTLDQLVDFVFLYDGFEKKLATLSYSRIVIDEVQMYSPDYLACLIMALKHIHKVGGRFSILTATFPPILSDKLRKCGIEFNHKKEPFYKDYLRHRAKVLEQNIDIQLIKENFNEKKKILVICNTVKKAQEIYNSLKDEKFPNTQINLLHSRYIKKHRSDKEKRILKMGKKDSNQYGIWVTTQIVEASLDIDFDELYTELSDVNGLFQRMGRVYRSRVLDHEKPNVYVYAGTDKEYPSLVNEKRFIGIDFTIFTLSRNKLLENQTKNITDYYENIKMDMVEEIYSTKSLSNKFGEADSYCEILNKTLNFLNKLEPYNYAKDELKLREIKQDTFIPLPIYEQNKERIDEIIKYSKSQRIEWKSKSFVTSLRIIWCQHILGNLINLNTRKL